MVYKIITYSRTAAEYPEEARQKFEQLVNSYLASGWQLVGGLSVDKGVFYQAIYFENKE